VASAETFAIAAGYTQLQPRSNRLRPLEIDDHVTRDSPLMRSARLLTALAVAAGLFAAPLAAQVPADSAAARQQRTLDSLLATVRNLQARLDSLARARSADTGAAAGGDLDALRAAAAAEAAPTADSTARLIGRNVGGRNQNAFNPEISVTGDVRSAIVRPGPQDQTFGLKEMELGFQSALDPFSVTKIFMGVGEDDISVEEAYVYWTGIPGHFRIDVGKFRQQLGELNRWHTHALPEGEYPLVLQRFVGEEGLAQTGVSLYWPLPISGPWGTFEATGQLTRGTDQELFGPYGGRPSVLGQVSGFWQFSRSTFGQLSFSALYGTGRDSVLTAPPPCNAPGCTATGPFMAEQHIETALRAVAARFTWRPPNAALRREVTVRSELFQLHRLLDGTGPTRWGWYVDAQTKLGLRWTAAVRYDHVDATDPAVTGSEWAITPTLTFWQSEFVFLRAQWTRHRDLLGATTDRIGIQIVWSMGPHKHELF
jgi:hypothetical protein